MAIKLGSFYSYTSLKPDEVMMAIDATKDLPMSRCRDGKITNPPSPQKDSSVGFLET